MEPSPPPAIPGDVLEELPQGLEKLQITKNSPQITYVTYTSELQLPAVKALIERDLSEPYSVYTYRYFINNWPNLCFLAMHGEACVGVIISKLDWHRSGTFRGYIAMLAVQKDYRKQGIAMELVTRTVHAMEAKRAEEVVLETEISNKAALCLYERLGFVRDKFLKSYYMNAGDAVRLKLFLDVAPDPNAAADPIVQQQEQQPLPAVQTPASDAADAADAQATVAESARSEPLRQPRPPASGKAKKKKGHR